MAERLTDLYEPGDRVELRLGASTADAEWQPGTVLVHDFPGVWVRAAGGVWFVTNSRRIRPTSSDSPEPGTPGR